jgi:hypothetical protein
VDSRGRTIFVADAHRDDGKRFIVHADEKLTAFIELEGRFEHVANWLDKLARFFQNSTSLEDLNPGVW